MNKRFLQIAGLSAAALLALPATADPDHGKPFKWDTVVNNNDLIPPLLVRTFNSYNQPSVNIDGVVVIRARSRGGPPLGPATHGIYVRDMSDPNGEVIRILDRTTQVPGPNNLGSTFTETPSFPRIDIKWPVIATRGNHQPVHRYELDDGSETRAGTTGIYTNPFGDLMMGEANFGHAPGQEQFGVPEFSNQRFEVFPGSPSITDGDTIVFKGNYTVGDIGKTGVYFRKLVPGPTGGDAPAIMIANNTDTWIPGTSTTFGSTAPPNAADGKVVFAGFDNEDAPTLGGIYLAALEYQPSLETVAGIGESVPGVSGNATFVDFGEAASFDGRYVGFWGAWGEETHTVRLYCQQQGNKDRIAYCNQALYCEATGSIIGDPNSICDGERCYAERTVPANQGIFVHDTKTGETSLVALNDGRFDDFLFWNYSGKPPCSSHAHSEEEGDLSASHSIKWRSSAFLAVSGKEGMKYRIAFKARSGDLVDGVYVDRVDGIYLATGPGRAGPVTLVDTTIDGQVLDPEAPPGTTVLELGVEREGFRGDWLAINAAMGVEGGDEEADGMAGVYIIRIKR
ncbi:MAG: hypothetical protein P8Y01_00905 [Woeseiaceae bacterium]|jgi:hypothetical protein